MTKIPQTTRPLPCGCTIPWDAQWFEALRKIGQDGAEPGEKTMTEEGVLAELAKSHVCKTG